jgi:PhnB protein
MPVSPIPPGYHTLTPTCTLQGAARAIELYQRVLGAKQRVRFDAPDGSVAHAELELGDSVLMLGEASEQFPPHGARLVMYVPDVDAVFQRAAASGFTVKQPLAVQFWGDRTGRLLDPFGNEWYLATHVEDVSEEEMQRRMAKLSGGG